MFDSIYKKVKKSYGYSPPKVNITKTLDSLKIQMFEGYNQTYFVDSHGNNRTDGSPILFAPEGTSIPGRLDMPHVFFVIHGGSKPAPNKLMVPLHSFPNPHFPPTFKESLISPEGVIDCSKIIERYNQDPRIAGNDSAMITGED